MTRGSDLFPELSKNWDRDGLLDIIIYSGVIADASLNNDKLKTITDPDVAIAVVTSWFMTS